MIEASDLTDQLIIEATMLGTDGTKGVRFEYNLPLRGKVTSEWADDVLKLKKGMLRWVESCRSAHVEQLREDALRQKRDAIMQSDSGTAEVPPARESRTSPANGPAVDPLEYVRTQVALLETELRHWTDAVQDATAKYEGAQRALGRWKATLTTLENEQ